MIGSIVMLSDGTGSPEVVRSLRTWSDQEILQFAVKVLYFHNFGRTNNCPVEVFLKWSDQSRTSFPHPCRKGLFFDIK